MSLSEAAVNRTSRPARACRCGVRCESTFPSLHIKPLRDLGHRHLEREQRTGMSCLTAMFAAVQSARADFPIEGRAATMIRLPGWIPTWILSELAETRRHAG
jgi:hypothetical protein